MKTMLSLVLLVLTHNAHARNFYEARFLLNVHYTSLDAGTQEVVSNYEVKVVYSDDHDFCYAMVGKDKFECHSYHPDADPESTMLTMDRPVAGDMIAKVLTSEECHTQTSESFARLKTYLSDTIDLEFAGQEFYQQIHDEQEEAFHIWMADLTRGTRY